ncbi:MAG TPA: aminoacetone oxidase family FAD-binding enzyme [Clostridiales bacterium]|nr:aminoacetone oxidase family FAD-binding enzyme [Clostridiales bacterium]
MHVAVIGGGASGMAAAYAAAINGAKTILFEKNEKLGKKLFISGKGRCNLTNDSDIQNHLANVVDNPRFLYSAYNAFSPVDLMRLMTEAGVSLKTERGDRVFPLSDKSSDIISAWQKLLLKSNVDIHLNETVLSFDKKDASFAIKTDQKQYTFDKLIIATGGFTYQATGSTGDGYRFARSFGHSIVPLRPSLVGIKAVIPTSLAGLSLKNCEITVKKSEKVLFSEFGEMLFTHSGISGPIVLTASAKINNLPFEELMIYLDLKPAITMETLDQRLIRELTAGGSKALKNRMPELLPKSLIEPILEQAGLDPLAPCHSITKADRLRLALLLKAFPIKPIGLEAFNGAIVTAGGVNVKEVDPKDMQSKLVSGLYFAGELLDVDALTGGYNLQIAFSTGYLAGRSAANA